MQGQQFPFAVADETDEVRPALPNFHCRGGVFGQLMD